MGTKIIDIIEPKVFAPYVIAQTTYLSNLIQSGIITQGDRLNALVSGGGRTINMPMWTRLSGNSEVLSDTTPLTPGKIGTAQDVAVMHLRGRAWQANELASAVAGSSAVDAIANQIAEYWVREEQSIFINTIKGVFDSAIMTAEHVLNKSTDKISAENVLAAKQLLGDASTSLSIMVMHSATFTALQVQNLILYIPNARGEIVIPTYLGYRVIQDDTTPVDNNVYSTYLFGAGVFGRGDGVPVGFTPVETDRDSLQGDDILINRRAFVLHPMGIKWKGSPAGTAPTNAELAIGTNWERVYERKAVPMVELKHLV